jgi:hypothetical protein
MEGVSVWLSVRMYHLKTYPMQLEEFGTVKVKVKQSRYRPELA